MTFLDWFPALSTSTVLAIVGFLLGTYYKAKVEKGIQHNVDKNLEEIRAQYRADEEALRANLRAKDEQISALRSGALSGMAARQEAISMRRLGAVENLWNAAMDQAPLKMLSKMTAPINMDYAIESAARQTEDGEKLRQVAEFLWQSNKLDDLLERKKDTLSPDKERPFVPPIAWALFSAYRQVLSYPVAQLAAMRTGVGQKVLADPKPLLDMVKAALPHQTEFVDRFGTSGLAHLMDELEETLLGSLRASLDSTETDDKSIEQAADIIRKVDTAAAEMNPEARATDLEGLTKDGV